MYKTYRVLVQNQYSYESIILRVTEALEVGVSNGYPPELYDLGVSQGASLLAALTRFIITDTETSTCNRKRINVKLPTISAVT